MQVWDKDSFSEDDRIGVARCSFRDIQSGLEVLLMSKDGGQGAPNGTLIFETCRMELKYYKFGGMANPALLRFYAEHVWNLPKPEVDSVCLAFQSVCLAIRLTCWPSLRTQTQIPLGVGRYGSRETPDVI